jgi:hypothetical protein
LLFHGLIDIDSFSNFHSVELKVSYDSRQIYVV